MNTINTADLADVFDDVMDLNRIIAPLCDWQIELSVHLYAAKGEHVWSISLYMGREEDIFYWPSPDGSDIYWTQLNHDLTRIRAAIRQIRRHIDAGNLPETLERHHERWERMTNERYTQE